MNNDLFGNGFMNTKGKDVGFEHIADELGISDIQIASKPKTNTNIDSRIAKAKKAIGVKGTNTPGIKVGVPDKMIQSLLSDDNSK